MTPVACVGHAKHITDRLRAMGFAHAEARYAPEQQAIICNWTLVGSSPAWRVPFVMDPGEASAEGFAAMFRTWQHNKRADYLQNRAGPILAGAIAAHGNAARQAIGLSVQ